MSDNEDYVQSIQSGMVMNERLGRLTLKWAAESEEYRLEARRLESADRTRHATSVAMLEARALAIDKCILDIQTFEKIQEAGNSEKPKNGS